MKNRYEVYYTEYGSCLSFYCSLCHNFPIIIETLSSLDKKYKTDLKSLLIVPVQR